MSLSVRIALGVAAFLAAYYGWIFWYAGQQGRHAQTHLKWTFPLPGGQDMCADPLSDGSVVASTNGTLVWINPDGTERARTEAVESRRYAEEQFFAWAAGAGDLCFYSHSGALTVRRKLGEEPQDVEMSARVAALDRQGGPEWEIELEGGPVRWLAYSDDACYALQATSLTKLSLDGEPLWTADMLPGLDLMAVTGGGRVYLVGFDGPQASVLAVDPDGHHAWLRPTVGAGGLPSVGPDGTLYVVSARGELTAFNYADGTVRWICAVPPESSGFSLRDFLGQGNYGFGYYFNSMAYPVLSGEDVCHLNGGRLVCVDNTGRQRWAVRVPGEAVGLAAGPDGTLYVSSRGYGLIAYGPNGRVLWRNIAIYNVTSAPSVGPDGTVFVEGDDKLFAFEP